MVKNLLSIAGLAVAGGIFFLYTQPAYDNVQVLKGRIAQYDQALDKAAELQQLKQSLLSRFNAFRPEDLDRLQKLLPDHVDNVRLILDLDRSTRIRFEVRSRNEYFDMAAIRALYRGYPEPARSGPDRVAERRG